MDPLTLSALGSLAAEVVQRSTAPVRLTRPVWFSWEDEADEQRDLLSTHLEGSPLSLLTPHLIDQIGDFCRRAESVALWQYTLIARFGSRETEDFRDLANKYRETFIIQAEEYCNSRTYNWAELSPNLWDLILAYMEGILPARRMLEYINKDESARINTYVGTAENLDSRPQFANIAFREVVDILGDPNRLAKSNFAVSDIRLASVRHYAEMNLAHALSHAVDNFRFDHGTLYVPRNLHVHNSDEYRSDSFLTAPVDRPRCVVIGSPGVGKSTMTQHLVYELSRYKNASDAYAPAVISCKEVAAADGSAFILGATTKSLKDNLQLDISDKILNDLATLGRIFLIFDGVDEIIDITRRRAFVRTIETFAARYPLIPILVTARRVGYHKAPIDVKEFTLYELDDFADDQVVTYTHKWFEATGRTANERDAFLRETESVPDVRTNPLMLSLLCALYRARGYIPRNRREVYRSCADLLFTRWDAMRQIEQPVDHRQYGNRLMQELALFFYKSQAAQGGVQEKQLRKIIAQFFTATASVHESDAINRAQDFLDFCADRAWLLTYQGTDERDQRLFGFTHRTFMEYFAAEAVVRRARSIDEIVKEVANAYERDASSVLADVILQCADDKYDGGARDVVSGLMEKARGIGRVNSSKYISLCLRIMNSAPLPPQSSDLIFASLFEHWGNTDPENTYTTAVSFFDLYRDPRNRILAVLRNNPGWALSALYRWARFYARDETYIFDPAWGEDMLALASGMTFENPLDGPLLAFLLNQRLIDLSAYKNRPSEWLVSICAYNNFCPGPLLDDLGGKVWETSNGGSNGLITRAAERKLVPASLPEIGLSDSFKVFAQGLPSIDARNLDSDEVIDESIEFILWACALLYEVVTPSLHEFHELVQCVYGTDWFLRVSETRMIGSRRQIKRDPSRGPEPFTRHELQKWVSAGKIPSWFLEWAMGKRSFILPLHQ